MNLTPLVRQNVILSSIVIVMFSIGCSTGFLTVLISQLQFEDSSIKLNINSISWIGSTYGFSGSVSFLIATLMQTRGRRFAFILCDVLMILGWSLMYIANSIEILLLALALNGLGLQSFVVIGLLIMSEYASPQYRNFWSNAYAMSGLVGTLCVHIMGMYIDWRSIILLADISLVISFIIACFWPESPAWLAEKRRFKECESVFEKIRESGSIEQKELQELLEKHSRFENNLEEEDFRKKITSRARNTIKQIKRRDFYFPLFLIVILLSAYYWGAGMIIRVFFKEMIKQTNTTETISEIEMLIVDVVLIIGMVLFMFFFVNFKNRTLIVYTGLASGVLLFISSVTLFIQDNDFLAEDSLVPFCFIIIFMLVYSVGLYALPLRIAGEVLPVKHRGLGGAIYGVAVFIIASSSMKLAPYMYDCLSLKVTFIIYDLIIFFCTFILWKYLPETKGKTLQQIEELYNNPYLKDINNCVNDNVVHNKLLETNIVC